MTRLTKKQFAKYNKLANKQPYDKHKNRKYWKKLAKKYGRDWHTMSINQDGELN